MSNNGPVLVHEVTTQQTYCRSAAIGILPGPTAPMRFVSRGVDARLAPGLDVGML
jgi:hypothetical protein